MSLAIQIKETRWLRLISEAIRGRSGNPTDGPIVPAIIALAVPMVLEMVMESLFAIVNIFWVGHLGAAATATIGLTESLLAIVYTMAAGLSIGVMAVVARRSGERDEEAASDATFQTILLGLIISVMLAVGGAFAAPSLLRVMGADAEVLRVGTTFARIMLAGSGSVLMLFMLNAAFRGSADAAIAMRVLWIANIINMILDPCLIFGLGPFPQLGVTGTAIATTTGRSIGVLIQLWVLFSGNARLKLARRHIKLHVDVMVRVLKLSANGVFQVFIATASWIGLVRVLSTFGSDALAGYTIAMRLVMFALLPAWGLANASATMVGQSLGADQPERAEQSVWIAGFMNFMFLGSIAVLFLVFAPFITHVFGGDVATTAYAVRCLRIVSAGFFFYAYGMVLANSFNGAGDTRTPTLLNLCCFWLLEIPVALVLSRHFNFGPSGVFLAIAVAFSTYAVAGAFLWRRGRWKLTVV